MVERDYEDLERWPAWLLMGVVAFMMTAAASSSVRNPGGAQAPPDAAYSVRIELPQARPLAQGEAELLLSSLARSSSEAESGAGPEAPGSSLEAIDLRGGPARDIASAGPDMPPAARAGELAAIDFDLSGPYARSGPGGSAIDIRKTVRFGGTDVGTANIRVSSGSTLSIARGELSTLLASAGRGDLVGQLGGARTGGFVSFDEMRREGVDIRYDALADRIVISL